MTSTKPDTVIGNARIVLADRVIEHGWIAFADGRIAEIGEGAAPAGSEDVAGDLIMPGLIELHTDHLEAHYVPRPKVFWDPVAAVVSYDGQLATSGITTVLDSLRVWREDGAEEVDGRAGVLAEAIASARADNLLRADHFLHLRCEITDPELVNALDTLIEPKTRGDPESPLRWTAKSTRNLASELTKMGHAVSHSAVAKILRSLKYSLQGTRKTLEGRQHPDRDAQFRYINTLAGEFLAGGDPVISVDTKKKELVGQYAQIGQEWHPQGEPVEISTYDFPSQADGKAIPYGSTT